MSGIPAGAGSLLGKRLGKYEILALLALGGTAEIYLARIGGAAGFEKYVVVKCLHDHLADDTEFVKMFLDEARLAAHLDHSNIVQTMELGEHENRYYMVMEFLAGLSLAMMVRRAGERLQGGKIPIPLAINILAQACAGLHYAHEKSANGKPLNIVHRDISPQNLVISFEGVVKVVDFGIAKAELRETQTRSGTIKGKFAYMSPEQCVANNVDRRTDVFALGVIGHELLTGRRLFKKNSPYETYQAVIECNVPPPSKLNVEVDPALDPIIMKALAKDKEQRYQTAEAFGDALLGYLHHRGKGSGPGEVSRFFDQHFSQEIDEHGARMRELISGREIADGMNWGGEDEEAAKKANETVDLGAPGKPSETSIPLDTMDLVEPSNVEGDAGDDEDEPAERTRIEANPLEALEELNQAAARPAAPVIPSVVAAGAPARKTPLPAALVPTQIAPATPPRGQPVMPPSGALPLPPAPTPPAKPGGAPAGPPPGAGPQPRSGKFPELANLPTMIAEPDEEPAEPELARTQLGALPLDLPASAGAKTPAPQVRPGSGRFAPDPGADPHGRTSMDMQAPTLPPSGQRPIAGPPSGQGPVAGPPGRPSGAQASLASYPVMNAELREQINLGATVFPSDAPPPRPSIPASAPPPLADSGPRAAPESAPPADSGPRDLLADLPGRAPTEMGARSLLDSSEPLFPRAADLASPVGKQYGGQVDWAAAAAMSAKAVPPWKLALIFIGAIGGALLLTMLVVMILR